MGKQTTFFVDFDITMFDYVASYQWVLDQLAAHGITKDMWTETYAKTKEVNTAYDRGYHYNLLLELASSPFSVEQLNSSYLSIVDSFIYPDTIEFLEKYKGNPKYIVSYGETVYQGQKITSTMIAKYFNEVFVTRGSKADVIAEIPHANGIFIDDRLEHLDAVQAKHPDIETVLIDRAHKYDGIDVEHHRVISSLSEL